jgi:imidazolonepropionase-like amidohydrolase
MRRAMLGVAALAALIAGCATTREPETTTKAEPSAQPTRRASADPYPSTYRPYPGVPTAITGATIFDGEGGRIENGTIVLAEGRIQAIGGADTPVPEGATRIDAAGRFVTPGVIDIHSHLGDYPSPQVEAHQDGNEVTGPVRPEVWAEHSIWPQDPGFTRALANGGITTLHVLPGSANLFGGRGVTLRNVPARTYQQMRFPGAPRSLKMACGENPKRVYGGRNQMPASRMANVALMRQTWQRASEYRDRMRRDPSGPRDLAMETLVEVLDGNVLVQNHCYRADEMAIMLDMAKEFGFKIASFHHAVEAYKIADLLRENGTCASVWADWWGFKLEAYDAVNENAPLIHNAGACAIIHSDDPNGIQRLNQETAKTLADGRRMGLQISDEVAWRWIAINPANALGIGNETGSLRVGKRADVVLWNGNPLSVYTRPQQVWIDGALMYDMNNPRLRPVTDFELGQPGEGDVK